MSTQAVRGWRRNSRLGEVRHTYDRRFKVYTTSFVGLNHAQYTELENFINSVTTREEKCEKEECGDTTSETEEKTIEAEEKTTEKNDVMRQPERNYFTPEEITCAKNYVINSTKYVSWSQLARHLHEQGFPLRSPETLSGKFARDQDIAKKKHEMLTKTRQAPTPAQADDGALTELVKSDEGFRRLLDARHAFVNDREKDRFEAYRQARNAKRLKPFTDDGTIVMTDDERRKELSAKYVSNDTARTYTSEGWER